MVFSFTEEQVRKLLLWKETLSGPENVSWYTSVQLASKTFNDILSSANFQSGGKLSPTQLDELFRQMRIAAHNRNLSNKLYNDNGIDKFNTKLRELLFSKTPLQDRIEQFVELIGIREVTFSHFLSLFDPKNYPFFSWETYKVLSISHEQETAASEQALAEYSVHSPSDYSDDTISYLKHKVVFRVVKGMLDVETYPLVNIVLWNAYDPEVSSEDHPGVSTVNNERELYDPVKKWIDNNWKSKIEANGGYAWTKITANVSRRNRLGMWSRPDLLMVDVSRFDFLPQKSVSVTSIEVKRADDTNLSSAYEAAAHQRWAHKAYLVVEVSNKDMDLPENLKAESSRIGVGLMKAYRLLESEDYELEELVPPLRQNPDPANIDEILKDFFADDESSSRRFKDIMR